MTSSVLLPELTSWYKTKMQPQYIRRIKKRFHVTVIWRVLSATRCQKLTPHNLRQ